MSNDQNKGITKGHDPKTGRFNSESPGRPKGSRHKYILAAEALLDGELEGLTRTCIEAAQNGDMTAMRLCIERSLPIRKSRPIQFSLPPLKSASDAPTAMAAIIDAVTAGEIMADEADVLVKLVEGYIKTIELTDLERRVRAIEAATSK